MRLNDFLSTKPMYYDQIDYTRFPRAYACIKHRLSLPKVVHVVGTNGKGSTGRFLAQILKSSGKKVGHYTSPHIFKFNERFWIDGKDVSDDELEKAHKQLLIYFDEYQKTTKFGENFIETLSYFEWATLLGAVLFRDLDEVVLEAGMGGEFDATNVFPKKLSIFTPVALDHAHMLGDSLEDIATTKLNSMDKFAVICSDFSLMDLAKNIAKKRGCNILIAPKEISSETTRYVFKFKLPSFLVDNLNLAVFSAKELGIKNIDEIVSHLDKLSLRGRLEKVAKNITIDVGHNAHAAKEIAKNFTNKVYLIYNAFDDKDIKAVLNELKHIVSKILIYEYDSDNRKLAGEKILTIAKDFGIPCDKFSNLEDDKDYLVFGSFVLVENFLKDTVEK